MSQNLTEKYRPKEFDDLVGQDQIKQRLKEVDVDDIQHLMFVGPAGVGKTTTANILKRQVFDEEGRDMNFKEMNASDERGIDTVRKDIKDFARTKSINADKNILFLDESDNLCVSEGTEVITGYPSKMEVKPIEEVSKEGEPIPSVDFQTNQIQTDRGKMVETGIAEFHRLKLSDGREILASPEHPFFTVDERNNLVETELQELEEGDEITDFQNQAGISRCRCGNWTTGTYCSVDCKDEAHSKKMEGDSNPMAGKEAWNRGKTKEDDKRIAKQGHEGEDNPNYGGGFNGTRIWDMSKEQREESIQKIRESMEGRRLPKETRDRIASSLAGEERESGNYRYQIEDEETVECEQCGQEIETEGRDGAYVHHVDGDRSNNSPDNLMVVCPPCHNEIHNTREYLKEGWKANPFRTGVMSILSILLVPPPSQKPDVDTVTVESIEFDHEGKAYNITMEGTPNFMLANGILTHNTEDAQQSLRRVMEKYSENCIFILSGNYGDNFIDPIKSRCMELEFDRIQPSDIQERLEEICEEEGLDYSDDALEKIAVDSDGDMRSAINSLWFAIDDGEVKGKRVHTAIDEMEQLVEKLGSVKYLSAREEKDKLVRKGIEPEKIVSQLYEAVKTDDELPEQAKAIWLEELADASYRMSQDTVKELQLDRMIWKICERTKELMNES